MPDQENGAYNPLQAKLGTYFAYTQKVETDRELTDLAKLIFFKVIYFTLFGEEGACIASNQFLSKLYGKSITTVSNSLRQLQDSGIIHIKLGKPRRVMVNHEYFISQAKGVITLDDMSKNASDEKVDTLRKLKESPGENDTVLKADHKYNINRVIEYNINMGKLKDNFKFPGNNFLFSDKTEKDLYIIVSEICEGLENYKTEDIKKAILQTVTKSDAYYRMIKAGIKEPERYKKFLLESTEKRLIRNNTTRITAEEQNTQDTLISQAEFYSGIVSEIKRITLKNMGYSINKENSSDSSPDNPQDPPPGEVITTFAPLLTMELAKDQKMSVVIEGTIDTLKPGKNKYKAMTSFGNLFLRDTEGERIHVQVNERLFGKFREQIQQARGERIKLLGNLGYNKYFKHNSIRAVKFLSIGLEEIND